MNYHEAENMVLKLIDRYSVAGTPMALSYNNQADFVAKIPSLLDDALSVIAATVRKLPKTVPLSTLSCETVDHTCIYTLPEDCVQVCLSGAEGARLLDENHLALPKGTGEKFLSYYRRPALLGDSPAAETELDGTPETHTAAAYYAAAYLMLHEDEYAHKALLTEWERRLARLLPLPRAEVGRIENVYGEGSA